MHWTWLHDKDAADLTAEEKQTISSIIGLAGATIGASTGEYADIASGAQIGQNAVDNNSLKAITTAAKILYKSVKKIAKNGRISYADFKDILKKEGLDILDNVMALSDGQLNWDDAKAIIDLVVGTSFNKANRGEALSKINKILDKDKKSSKVPVPDTTKAKNGLNYKSNPKHTAGGDGNRFNAGIEPSNSLELFENSIESPKKYPNKDVRYSKDQNGNIHRFEGTNGQYHWNGSTADPKNPLDLNNIPQSIKNTLGKKGRK